MPPHNRNSGPVVPRTSSWVGVEKLVSALWFAGICSSLCHGRCNCYRPSGLSLFAGQKEECQAEVRFSASAGKGGGCPSVQEGCRVHNAWINNSRNHRDDWINAL